MSDTALQKIADAKSRGDFTKIANAIPYAQFMGISMMIEPSSSQLTTTMAYGDHLVGNPALPALHGGTLGALLETAVLFEVLHRSNLAEMTKLPKTITFTVEYLRSAGAVTTYACADVTRVGRRVTNVSATAWQGDRNKPVATARALLLLV
jgi:uncharacterized protein (TIGR00369 family)